MSIRQRQVMFYHQIRSSHLEMIGKTMFSSSESLGQILFAAGNLWSS
uniref:Uncharacterized protein n=1 Tax=Arundo donax TaxID=35708 RepID=A0A0A9F8B2_ARUDO